MTQSTEPAAAGPRPQLVVGDITRQDDLDAVVNAANAELMPGGGVAGAIHRAAGPQLAEACRPLAPIRPGRAVITPAFGLPNRWVIHCLGPVYGMDEPASELLASCYREALRLAAENGVRGLGLPALSTGAFGYPMREAAPVALQAVLAEMHRRPEVDPVRFVLFDEAARREHEAALQRLLEGA